MTGASSTFGLCIDMHVHLRKAGYEYREDIRRGTEAAALGGITAVNCMPNTDPANDHVEIIRFIVQKAQAWGRVRARPIGAMFKSQIGEGLFMKRREYETSP